MPAPHPKVLVIGWDAADWKVINPLMDAGRMPNLQRLVERGSMGRAATLHPPLSPMLWTSIATGKRPFKHGIHGFSEPTPDGRGVRPITNLSRTSKAVWNILNQNGIRSNVIGWWPSHPAEPINGVMVSDHYHKAHRPLDQGWPMLPHTVHPPELHDTLADLRLHPQELLGPMLTPFVPLLEKVDQHNDRRFAGLCKTISECVNIHSAATWLMDNQPWDFFAVYYDAIDHFCHGFMKYYPPRRPWIPEADFELYSEVVSTAYVLHDQMLGTLLEKAGQDTTVILMSDHGFHPDHLRPSSIPDMPAGPAVEHSPYGIFVMAGPGIRKEQSLFGVSVLDLTPTVLALYGLPPGADMDGQVVTDAFENPPDTTHIPSWENVPGDDGRHPPHTRMDGIASAEAMEQLIALGYVEKPGEDIAEYVESTVQELRYNLVESLQDGGLHSEALGIARDLCRRDPDEQRYALKRFLSCQALGLHQEMREIVTDLAGRRRSLYDEAVAKLDALRVLARQRYEERQAREGKAVDPDECERELNFELDPKREPPEPRQLLLQRTERKELLTAVRHRRYGISLTSFLEAQTLVAERRLFEGLELLQRLSSAPVIRPALLLQTADLMRRLGRHTESEAAYRRALSLDPDNVQVYLGLSRLALRKRNFTAAERYASECVGRLFFYPMAHFLRAIARIGLRDYENARESLHAALSQNPHFPQAHLWLARLLRARLNDPEGAKEHLRWYREMRQKRSAPLPALTPAASAEADIADVSPEAELPPLGDDILVVSGLPRSGTSMLMQMLNAGGATVHSDNIREADEDNPKGYFELEAVKSLRNDAAWVAEARGKALKVVAPLVCSLPTGSSYRVLLIERNYDEILASQAQMIERRGEPVVDTPERRERLRGEFARIVGHTKRMLKNRNDVHVLQLRYEDIIREPADAARRIDRFVGGTLDSAGMAAAVDRSLHRNVAVAN